MNKRNKKAIIGAILYIFIFVPCLTALAHFLEDYIYKPYLGFFVFCAIFITLIIYAIAVGSEDN